MRNDDVANAGMATMILAAILTVYVALGRHFFHVDRRWLLIPFLILVLGAVIATFGFWITWPSQWRRRRK